jgi:cytochrome P450
MGTKLIKTQPFYEAIDMPHSSVFKTDPEEHRRHRQTMEKYFTRNSIYQREKLFQKNASIFLDSLASLGKAGKDPSALDIFRAWCLENICQFTFNRSAG